MQFLGYLIKQKACQLYDTRERTFLFSFCKHLRSVGRGVRNEAEGTNSPVPQVSSSQKCDTYQGVWHRQKRKNCMYDNRIIVFSCMGKQFYYRSFGGKRRREPLFQQNYRIELRKICTFMQNLRGHPDALKKTKSVTKGVKVSVWGELEVNYTANLETN